MGPNRTIKLTKQLVKNLPKMEHVVETTSWKSSKGGTFSNKYAQGYTMENPNQLPK